jgi:hypothetical protein
MNKVYIFFSGTETFFLNETSDYLDNIDKKERELIISAARKQTSDILKKIQSKKSINKIKNRGKSHRKCKFSCCSTFEII